MRAPPKASAVDPSSRPPRLRSSFIVRLCFAGTALGLLALTGCAAHRKIDIGGYRLNLQCAGKGSPTVVMDSGLGDTLETWSEVFPRVREVTRVCAYDRAGLGRSDAGPMPRTSERIVQELHTLLKKAGVAGPYLLVGHSFGGLNVRLYASEFPNETAGLVLVEATHEDYPALERTVRSPAESRKIENAFGMARPAAQSEYQSIGESVSQVRSAPPLPDVPAVVITAGRKGEAPLLRDLWMKLQRELTNKIPHSRQVMSSESGHYVQFDDPALVAAAIRDVTEAARQRLTPTP